MYHQVSTFHCNWYESTSATATLQPNVFQWIDRTTLSPLVAAPAASELFGGSFDWKSSEKNNETNLLCKKDFWSEKQFVFQYQGGLPLFSSSWTFSNLLKVWCSKKASKKKVLPGPFGCLMMLAARFYPPGESTAKKHQLSALSKHHGCFSSSISITAWLRFAKSLAKFCSCAAFFSVVGFHVLRCPAFGSTTYSC